MSLTIGAGDHVAFVVFDTPSLSFTDRVDEAGNVKAPVLGSLHIAGLTTVAAARLFEDKLRAGDIMLQPSVTVEDTELATQGIVVLGQVRGPGTFTLLGPHNLYDALSAAGGVLDNAGSKITITHQGNPATVEEIAVNSPNFSEVQRTTQVYPGDMIFVSKADIIYVVGDVVRSGAFFMQNGHQLSVMNALALAGGNNFTSADNRAAILRKTPQGVTTIPIDLKQIKKNKAPDLKLQAEDVLVLPRSGLKVFVQAVLPGLATSGGTAAIDSAVLR